MKVWSSGARDSGFQGVGLGSRVCERQKGVGFRAYPSAQGSALRIRSLGVGVRVHEGARYPITQKVHEWVEGFGYRIQEVRFGVGDQRFRVLVAEFRTWGLGCRVYGVPQSPVVTAPRLLVSGFGF